MYQLVIELHRALQDVAAISCGSTRKKFHTRSSVGEKSNADLTSQIPLRSTTITTPDSPPPYTPSTLSPYHPPDTSSSSSNPETPFSHSSATNKYHQSRAEDNAISPGSTPHEQFESYVRLRRQRHKKYIFIGAAVLMLVIVPLVIFGAIVRNGTNNTYDY